MSERGDRLTTQTNPSDAEAKQGVANQDEAADSTDEREMRASKDKTVDKSEGDE